MISNLQSKKGKEQLFKLSIAQNFMYFVDSLFVISIQCLHIQFMQNTIRDWGFATSYRTHGLSIQQQAQKGQHFVIKNSQISLNKRYLPSTPQKNKESYSQSVAKPVRPQSLKVKRKRDSQCSETGVHQAGRRRVHSMNEKNGQCLIFSRFLSPFLQKKLAQIPQKPIQENIKTVRKYPKRKQNKSQSRLQAEHNLSTQKTLSEIKPHFNRKYPSLAKQYKFNKNPSSKETYLLLPTKIFTNKKYAIPKLVPSHEHIKQLHQKKRQLIQKRISLKMKPLKP